MEPKARWLLPLLAALAAAGCRCSDREAPPAARPGDAGGVAPPAPARCTAAAPGKGFVVGDLPPATGDAGDDEALVDLPFAIEAGSAVALPAGFAVGALRSVAGSLRAFVALTDAQVTEGRLVELGRVHGDHGPPRLASQADVLVAVVPDADASGARLRLARLSRQGDRDEVTWGAEHPSASDGSPGYDVALGERRGLLVWDDLDPRRKRGRILGSTFDPAELGNATAPRELTPDRDDAVAPRVLPRGGGFWLAWLAQHVSDAPRPARARAGKDPADVALVRPSRPALAGTASAVPVLPPDDPPEPPAAELLGAADPGQPDDPLLDIGERSLRLVALDAQGSPVAEPLRITDPRSRVVVFDLAVLADGAVLLAWRDERSASLQDDRVELAKVGLDGSVLRGTVLDDAAGAGLATVLAGPGGGGPLAHLALAGLGDETRLVSLGADLQPLDALAADRELGVGEPVATSPAGWLVSEPRGLALRLRLLRCGVGAPPTPAAASAPEPGLAAPAPSP